ncbi:MAG: 30S ribosomal protein S20 [Candidatus Hatepunaea meridiana]|nr:30S ribosomal protein S20 [Candidatus Hatepunaea meridiana]
MAHHKSTIKRIKTSRKANLRNRHYRSLMRNAMRKVREGKNTESLNENLRTACSILDRLVSKGIVHRNTAARRKSNMHRMVTRAKV